MVGHFMRGLLGDCCHCAVICASMLLGHGSGAALKAAQRSTRAGSKGAKRPLERPLDGAVRCHLVPLAEFVFLRRV